MPQLSAESKQRIGASDDESFSESAAPDEHLFGFPFLQFALAPAANNPGESQRRRAGARREHRSLKQSHERADCESLQTRAGAVGRLLWELGVHCLHRLLPRVFVGRSRRPPTNSEADALRLLNRRAVAFWGSGGKVQAACAHLRALNFAERFYPSSELVHAYAFHAAVLHGGRWSARARRCADSCVQLCDALGDQRLLCQAMLCRGAVRYFQSRFSECIVASREAIRLAQRLGDVRSVSVGRYYVVASLYRLGDLGEAMELIREATPASDAGEPQMDFNLVDVWARIDARSMPEEILSAATRRLRARTNYAAKAWLAQGVWLIAQDETTEAIKVLRRAADSARDPILRAAYGAPALAWIATAQRIEVQRCITIGSRRRRRMAHAAYATAREALRASRTCMNELPRALRECGYCAAMLGWNLLATWYFDRSVEAAEQQQARYELAQSRLAQSQFDHELDRTDSSAELERAQAMLNAFSSPSPDEPKAPPDEPATTPHTSFSLASLFEVILEIGRSIASALDKPSILDKTCSAVARLLRSDACEMIDASQFNLDGSVASHREGGACEQRARMIAKAVETRSAVAEPLFAGVDRQPHEASTAAGCCLCAPIYVHGRISACLYAVSRASAVYGVEELRLADFLASIAGAALENADGFRQLQSLNETLEQRVASRTIAVESRAAELARSNRELKRVAEELQTVQDQLRAAIAEAESATHAKSQFLATMSHEIRTPMNGILGMTELALRTSLTPQQRGYLTTVKQSGDALLALLNDVLDLSKIEAGKMTLEEIPFDLYDVVRDSVRTLSASAFEKGLELVSRIDPALPAQLIGDPNRLRQIIVNLVGNAVKFTASGQIVVSVDLFEESRQRPLVHFSVSDTGIGIPAEKQQAVFEAFEQSDNSTTRRFGGTGLGLSITSQLVRLMNGRMWLDSKVGQGATFHFAVPLARRQPATNRTTANSTLCGVDVLVVTKNRTSGEIYRELLTARGARVDVRDSRTNAMQVAARESDNKTRRRAAVVDVPGEDDELARLPTELKQLTGATWKVVTLASPHLIETQFEKAADCHLPKPASVRELVAAVRGAFSSKSCESTVEQPPHEVVATHPLRVLLADDSPVNREVAAGLLEMQGHAVTTVENGAIAIEAYQRAAFDVILMDVEMPVMDGLEATSRIRQLEAESGSRTAIVAMTAHAAAAARRQCVDAGMNGYLAKPIKPEELFHMLRQHASTETATEP